MLKSDCSLAKDMILLEIQKAESYPEGSPLTFFSTLKGLVRPNH